MESVAGTGMKGIGAGTGAIGTIAFGTIMGGAASALAGGNFWQGAVSGMIVSTFNHAMHGGFAKKYKITSLHDYEAANGAGHDALAFENEDGSQHYVSKDGTEDHQNAGVYGESKFTIRNFDSIDEINDYYSAKHGGNGYDISAVYKATRAQINRGIVAAEFVAKGYYSLIGNSCTDVLSYGLSAAFSSNFFSITLKCAIPNLNFFIQPVLYNSHFINYNLLK